MVSPDAGGVERARFFAKKMDAALAIVDKRRVEMNVAEVMHVIGDVQRPHLPDHRRLDRHGGNAGEDRCGADGERAPARFMPALRIRCCRVRRWRTFRSPASREVVVTNTIPLSEAAQREPKIKVLSIAGLIGRAIQSIHEETSVSRLFCR